MSTLPLNDEPPSLRYDSPSPDLSPTRAIGPCPPLSRCLSASSSASHGSNSDATTRESLGSDRSRLSSSSLRSRSSDASVPSRHSSYSLDGRGRRRGFIRPQGTDFAASARSRESVLSLGSIAHIQHFFARTGLLDGKGAQLARKRRYSQTLNISDLESHPVSPTFTDPGAYPSYSPLARSPDPTTLTFGAAELTESPVGDGPLNPDDYYDLYDESDQNILPPTTSTYNHVEKFVPKPPTAEELKSKLTGALGRAYTALKEVKDINDGAAEEAATTVPQNNNSPRPKVKTQGWFEIQGMHILDVMTLAIRAAKLYYTAHDNPERLDAIKPEKEVRADLLGVMEVLKQVATREFSGGIRNKEVAAMEGWLNKVSDMLKGEEEIEEAERKERAGWSWLKGDWTGREMERELAFIRSIDPDAEPLPEWSPAKDAEELPTPFLKEMQNGLRLVRLHNAAVWKSQRRFGAIPTFHTDTLKPYRSADNIRYWSKAAELRWEVFLKVDALGIVYNNGPQVWLEFETALLKWCRKVREEIAGELENSALSSE